MEIYGMTDVGSVRTNNEDGFFIKLPNFCVVADGMGGHAAGEVASGIALKSMQKAVEQGRFEQALNLESTISEIVQEINCEIYNKAQENERALSGMGTTLTLIYEKNGEVYWGHVGDSRLYLWSGQHLRQITEDHSLVAELLRKKVITEEEAGVHPQKNAILRALGSKGNIEVDVNHFSVQRGDYLLLCTDGLTNMVADDEINHIFITAVHMEAAVKKLIAFANEQGGRDNITAVLASY